MGQESTKKPVKEFDEPKSVWDIMTIRELFEAADFELDDACDGQDDDCLPNVNKTAAHSFRLEGAMVYLFIKYDQFEPWDLKYTLEYEYKVHRVKEMDFTVVQEKYEIHDKYDKYGNHSYGVKRTKAKEHGLRVKVV